MTRILLTTIHLLLISSLSLSQSYYFPERNEDWKTKQPKDFKLDTEKINSAVQFALDHEYTGSRDLKQAILKGFEREPYHNILGPTKERGGPAGMILKNGYVIAKWGDTKRVDMTFSVTKSFLSTVAGLAVDKGLIASVEDSVKKYVWTGEFEGRHNSKIKWRHLLNQSSDWTGQLWGGLDWADRPPREGDIDDWKFRELKEPGSNFEYNDVRVNLLAYSLLHVWRQPLPKVLKMHVMDPIGASTTWRWFGYENSFVNVDGINIQSVSGGGHSGGGMFINTEDMARFGLLFLNDGKWKEERIISTEWIDEATKSSKASERYGFMWWLSKDNDQLKYFYAAGFGGNFIIVNQKNDLVVVTRWLNPPDYEEFTDLLYKAID